MERGAILPLFALMMVVLLMFAAFTIDFGLAWGQRTLNQSAVDGGVMAGAVSFIDDPQRANPGIVGEIERFVDANLGYSISDPGVLGGGEWATCVDPKVVSGDFAPLVSFDASGTSNALNPCISLSTGPSERGEKTLRVYLPRQLIDTAFAGIVGVDELSTGALAEAELDFAIAGGALPFVVPSGLGGGDEFCIGEMPPGLAGDACNGSSKGKRNDIISPWHGTDDPGTPACTNDTVDPNQLSWNIALGVDHLLRAAGDKASTNWRTNDGRDICRARDAGYIPYALRLGSGGEDAALIEGFAGDPGMGSAANAPGRLRQGSGDTRYIDGNQSTDPHNMDLDNVGLWKYLFHDGITDSANKCDGDNAVFSNDGATAISGLEACLASSPSNQIFSEAILQSPRFAIMPQLFLNQNELDAISGSSSFVNIKRFIPGYIQKTFWNCTSSDDGKKAGDLNDTSIQCALTFRTYEDEAAQATNDITDDQQWFAPGEGNSDACLVTAETGNPRCKKNPNIALRGVSAIILRAEWLPAGAVPSGDPDSTPYEIALSR
jgi:hypothetical protein